MTQHKPNPSGQSSSQWQECEKEEEPVILLPPGLVKHGITTPVLLVNLSEHHVKAMLGGAKSWNVGNALMWKVLG